MGPQGRRKVGLFLASAAVMLFAGLAIGFIFFGRKEPEYAVQNRLFYPQTVERATANLDTDGDGLKDWEEILYGTDVKNPDTDGDGTADGEEILSSRDPLKAGELAPESEWSDSVKPAPNAAEEESGPKENLTQTVAERLIPLYLEQRQNGQQFDPQALAEQILGLVEGGSAVEPRKIPDLKFKDDASPAAVKSYLNSLAEISQKYLLNWKQDPLVLFASIGRMDQFEGSQLYRLDPYVKNVETALTEFIALTAPRSWEKEHRELVENVLVLGEGVKAMRQSDQDIILTLTKIRPYLDAAQSLRRLVSNVKNRLRGEEIIFSKEEPMANLLLLTP